MAKHKRYAAPRDSRPVDAPRPGPVEVKIELEGIALPERSFEADVISVVEHHGTVAFRFLQIDAHPAQLIEVRMPFESFGLFLASVQAQPFAQTFREWIDRNAARQEHVRRQVEQQPKPDAILRAQLARVAQSGSDAEMLFYSVSANGLVDSGKSASTMSRGISPLLRVTCHTLALSDGLTQAGEVGASLGLPAGVEP